MLHLKNSIYLLLIVALIAAPLALMPKPAAAQVEYTCLPTCEGNDARFLSVAGTGLATIADQPIILTFAAPADSTSLEIGIFDGNTAGMWDFGTTEAQYTLYADPLLTGDTSTIVAQRLGSSMPNNENAWSNFVVPNVEAARSPSGNYFYRMEVRPVVLNTRFWSNFKVRTDGLVMLNAQPFSYVAPLLTDADRGVIYPNFPDLSGTTYNGRFNFHFYVPVSVASMVLWDGDFDHGSYNRVDNDTDDPNTPGAPFLPSWADPANTNFEGVAIGNVNPTYGQTTGAPSDDSQSDIFRRSPSIAYDLVLPDGRTFTNNNPTGNVEWEQFVIGPASGPTLPDYPIDGQLPSGMYSVRGRGVDISNLNAWKFSYNVVGVCGVTILGNDPDPCKPPLFPFKIGDSVFQDTNGNGVQDPGEAGIPGVRVYLLDGNGQPINDIHGNPIFAITDANGIYTFNVPNGTYTVRVGADNFNPGGPLEGTTSTTGGNELTRTVNNANDLTYDFGYRQPPPPLQFLIGDTVFSDLNGNHVQDPGEPGIPGVVIYLLDGNGQPVNTAVTDSNGNYTFNVPNGTYTVRVGAENFNLGGPLAGATSTTGGEELTRTVNNANDLTYDFGYQFPPSVCVVTPGIWKTAFKDRWPVDSITVADVTYTREQAILIMSSHPNKYDMTYQLFAQVVAAKLNVLEGNPSACIDVDIETAETWLINHPLGSGVAIDSPAWMSIMYTFKNLSSYNKGRLCADACTITPVPPPTKPPKPIKVGPAPAR
jgi:hypothetical protein